MSNTTLRESSGYLALCLWCKNENRYLREWIDYHLLLGVDHIFVIDNNSDIPLANEVSDYIDRGIVTLETDASVFYRRQCVAYARSITRLHNRFRWLGFFDTDEFVVPKNGQLLPAFLRNYESCGGLGVFWHCFGSNGHLRRQPSVLEAFTKRSASDFGPNTHIKSFVNTEFVAHIAPPNPHCFRYRGGRPCVDENGEPIVGPMRQPRTSALIQLNHYFLRSAEDWEEKLQRGGGNSTTRRSKDYFTLNDRECNAIEDRSALDLRAALILRAASLSPPCLPCER